MPLLNGAHLVAGEMPYSRGDGRAVDPWDLLDNNANALVIINSAQDANFLRINTTTSAHVLTIGNTKVADDLRVLVRAPGGFEVGSATGGVDTKIYVQDNEGVALEITQNTNRYVLIDTTDGSETITLGNAVTDPTFTWLGAGPWNVGGGTGSAGQVLKSNGGAASPSWQADSGGTDQLVKVSANDTTADYLGTKLVAGTNITLNELNDGLNETLEIVAAGGGGLSITGTDNRIVRMDGTNNIQDSAWEILDDTATESVMRPTLDEFVIGAGGHGTLGTRTLVIGADATGTGPNGVVVGNGSDITGGGSNGTGVGQGFLINAEGGQKFGSGGTVSYRAGAYGSGSSATGNYSLVLGHGSSNTGADSIVFGRAVSATTDNQVVFQRMTTFRLGAVTVGNPTATVGLEAYDGSAGIDGAGLKIQAGDGGTGTADGGDITIRAGAVTGTGTGGDVIVEMADTGSSHAEMATHSRAQNFKRYRTETNQDEFKYGQTGYQQTSGATAVFTEICKMTPDSGLTTSVGLEAEITGNWDDAGTVEYLRFSLRAVATNKAGTVAMETTAGANQEIFKHLGAGSGAGEAQFAVNGSDIELQVKGIDTKTVNWVAEMKWQEIRIP